MMYDKKEFERGGLIAILRNCGEAGVRACSECPLEPVYHGDVQCIGDLMTAAADRLEEYVDRCARFSEEIMVLRGQKRWIPVEERLPEKGERVLATDGGFVGEFYLNKQGQWQRYNVNDNRLLMALDILWWQPLPPAPEEVNNGKNG